jgi:hypothetical protein
MMHSPLGAMGSSAYNVGVRGVRLVAAIVAATAVTSPDLAQCQGVAGVGSAGVDQTVAHVAEAKEYLLITHGFGSFTSMLAMCHIVIAMEIRALNPNKAPEADYVIQSVIMPALIHRMDRIIDDTAMEFSASFSSAELAELMRFAKAQQPLLYGGQQTAAQVEDVERFESSPRSAVLRARERDLESRLSAQLEAFSDNCENTTVRHRDVLLRQGLQVR